MATVNTNPGALVALQNLNRTNDELSMIQNRINTGLKVASAKDDGGTFAIAQRMRGDVASYGAVQNSLDRGISSLDVAIAAGEAVSDLLVEMKGKALAATDASLDTASRTALNADFQALRDQIGNIVQTAEFNGVNLIDGSVTDYAALGNPTGSVTLTVTAQDLSLSGSLVTVTSTDGFATSAEATSVLNRVTASIDNVSTSLAKLGTEAKALEIQSDYVTKLSDALETGIGNLVDADLARESANLEALQVKQQLGVQALSIANQAPGIVLGLFR